MSKKEKPIKGAISVWSNSYDSPTGYGQQVKLLVDRLVRDGAEVAMLSNYGLEGTINTLRTPYGEVKHYPRGLDLYSNDVAPNDHSHFTAKFPDLNDLFISLYDVWVMKSKQYDKLRKIAAWTPLDHVTTPPEVEQFLRKPNVVPIAMAPNGVRQLTKLGIECEYVPHAIDTKVMKPTELLASGLDPREMIGGKDKFIVGMVAANKSNGMVHRKAFSENIMAFSIFHKKHPDAVLYIHTDPLGRSGGWSLPSLLSSLGLPESAVCFPDPNDYRFGLSHRDLAAFYSSFDVLLATSYGEGFGVPTMEAQACGTRVIASGWAASEDLVSEDGWLVGGTPTWNSGQNAWWQIPNVPSIVDALEQAYELGKSRSETSVVFAQDYDVEKVWRDNWLPTINKLLA
jgi:glycosyltransferase involved in cell wall biosynthesis